MSGVGRPHLPETLSREGVAGARLQITLEIRRFLLATKRDVSDNTPGLELSGMRRFPGVMFSQSPAKVRGYPYIALGVSGAVFEQIYVVNIALLR